MGRNLAQAALKALSGEPVTPVESMQHVRAEYTLPMTNPVFHLAMQAEEPEAMADYADEAISEVPGVRVLPRDPRHTTRSFYRYILAIESEVFGLEHDAVCYALDQEGIPCWVGYEAMHRYDLFQLQLSRLPVPSAFLERFRFDERQFPAAERVCEREAVWSDESVFRSGRQGVDDAVAALRKIYENRDSLATKIEEWLSM
jgi:dTDP-4-amino-4,6-dideoxygalactose transaminase